MSLRTKILSFVAIACFFCTAAAVYTGVRIVEKDLTDALVAKSEAILTRLESARKYVANQGLLEQTIKDTVRQHPSGVIPDDAKQRILNVVPIYAALKIGADEAAKDKYKFRVATRNPRRAENMATPEEAEFLAQFEADANLKQIVHHDESGNAIWVMRPIRLAEKDGCLNCHGNPNTSPWKNGKDILGYKMENWADGHLHGMFKIVSSTDPVAAEVKRASSTMVLWALGLLVGALVAVTLLLRKPIKTLDDITDRLAQSAVLGMDSSRELGDAAQAVSASTSEQAAGVQETMSSMSEMTAMIAKTQELASDTQKLSSELDSKSRAGMEVMNSMVSSMGAIKASNDELKKMVQIINDISTKTNVINDIVFKTQLLSVNASIEAARAGQHGKGFAVVAEEVGNLAQVSGKAAEEIREMLNRSQVHVQDVVEVTSQRVTEGERVSQDAMKAFEVISEGINKIQSYSLSVSEATSQQKEGITQIGVAMNQMDEASQQNSAMSTNVAKLSDNMLNQSQELKMLSEETQILVNGKLVDKPREERAARPPARSAGPKSGADTKGKMEVLRRRLLASKSASATTPARSNGNGTGKHDPALDADSDDFGSSAA